MMPKSAIMALRNLGVTLKRSARGPAFTSYSASAVYARPKSRKNQMSGLQGQTKAAVMKVTAFMRRPNDRKWWKIISMSLPF